jgi:hypothetical protein
MDLSQTKLTKSEWDAIEIPVNDTEKKILKMMMDGYIDVNVRCNDNLSMLQLLKLSCENGEFEYIHGYLFKTYFISEIHTIINKMKELQNGNKEKKDKKSKEKEKEKKERAKEKEKAKRERKDNGDVAMENEMVENTFTVSYLELIENWCNTTSHKIKNVDKKMKKANILRINHMNETIHLQKQRIFEYVLLEFCEKIILSLFTNTEEYCFYLYTLIQFKKNSIQMINTYMLNLVDSILSSSTKNTDIETIFFNSVSFIEKNKYLLKYGDMTLYSHQKQLFSIFNKVNTLETPNLVLYTAPTGTGKTMSPIGLTTHHRVIFVCVARHVGLALAKSAISMNKKVAFAFGCETASDIRLHYFSAVSYSINNKSGGIYKVDNSVGTNVELMICDVKSYLTAMHYMLAFNDENHIITYWDEPTITMDYETHELHETIHRNWVENKISNMVLSCATLPKEEDIQETIQDFRFKFDNAEIHTISSYDCKKSISILNKEGKCVLPHYLFRDESQMKISVNYCIQNKAILRYFDLHECVEFIKYVLKNKYVSEIYSVASYFKSISDITMNTVKVYYLEILSKIDHAHWNVIYSHMKNTHNTKYRTLEPIKKIKSVDVKLNTSLTENVETNHLCRTNSINTYLPIQQSMTNLTDHGTTSVSTSDPTRGIMITTSDAHTLTDGPTIYLAEDIEKIGKFCIQQSKIPEAVFKDIISNIRDNDTINKRISIIEKELEDKLGDCGEKDKKLERESNKDVTTAMNKIKELQNQIKCMNMELKYIPNTKQHQQLWSPGGEFHTNAFTPRIDDSYVKEIMLLPIDNNMKLLLLIGIGVFMNQPNIQYMEIMKKLAMEQKLYLIIAQSDYIYGTNYQFCHGFIGKDLTNMTQQKIIQSIGRIGRNNIQQEYTVRFRNDELLERLFLPQTENMEAVNMCRLFCSDI